MLIRLKQFIDGKKMTINKFETVVGLGSGTILKAMKSNKDIGSDKLFKIAQAFPDLDMNWLLSGVQVGELPEEYMYKKKIDDGKGIRWEDKSIWYNRRLNELRNEYEIFKSERETIIRVLTQKVDLLETELKACREGK